MLRTFTLAWCILVVCTLLVGSANAGWEVYDANGVYVGEPFKLSKDASTPEVEYPLGDMLLLTEIEGAPVYYLFDVASGTFAISEQYFLTSDCTGTRYVPANGLGVVIFGGTFIEPRTDGVSRSYSSRIDELGVCHPSPGGISFSYYGGAQGELDPQPGWVEPLQMVLVEPMLPPAVATGGVVVATLIAAAMGWGGVRRIRSKLDSL